MQAAIDYLEDTECANEPQRVQWAGRKRKPYVHDDIVFTDAPRVWIMLRNIHARGNDEAFFHQLLVDRSFQGDPPPHKYAVSLGHMPHTPPLPTATSLGDPLPHNLLVNASAMVLPTTSSLRECLWDCDAVHSFVEASTQSGNLLDAAIERIGNFNATSS